MFRTLLARSIWAKGLFVPDTPDWKMRNLKRLYLPAYDVVGIIVGILVTWLGLPALNLIFPPPVVDWLGLILSLVSTACLFGVSFPNLWKLEVGAKSLLMGILVSYIVALVALSVNSPDTLNRLAVAAMVVLTLPLPLFRMSLLGDELKERRDAE